VVDYRVPSVFTKDEVKVLDRLKNIASREDYVVAWWDYGIQLGTIVMLKHWLMGLDIVEI